jgi:hypothetical protein
MTRNWFLFLALLTLIAGIVGSWAIVAADGA